MANPFVTVVDFDDDDDFDSLPTCVVCKAPVPYSTSPWNCTCSEKCERVMDDLEARTGTCSWCGRSGPIGKSCIRKVPGTDEKDECGQFG
jgi:hypothetical protein